MCPDRYNKKAGLQSCWSVSWGSGIAFLPKQQHRSPRRMHKCAQYAPTLITYLWASCAAMFWVMWIYQIPGNQNKARKTPFSICPVFTPHPERHIPSAWAKYGKTFLATRAQFILRCKITKKKWHLQIKVPFFCIFIVFSAYYTYLGARLRLYVYIFLTAFLRCRYQRNHVAIFVPHAICV